MHTVVDAMHDKKSVPVTETQRNRQLTRLRAAYFCNRRSLADLSASLCPQITRHDHRFQIRLKSSQLRGPMRVKESRSRIRVQRARRSGSAVLCFEVSSLVVCFEMIHPSFKDTQSAFVTLCLIGRIGGERLHEY